MNDEDYANKQDANFNLSNLQIHAIKLLSQKNMELSIEQEQLVNIFLVESLGNMELNRGLDRIRDSQTTLFTSYGFDKEVIDNLYKFTYKTRHHAKIDDAFEKLSALDEQIKNNLEGDEVPKLNFDELTLLCDIRKVKTNFDFISKKVDFNNPTLDNIKKLYNNIKKTDSIFKRLESDISKELDIQGNSTFALTNYKKIAKSQNITDVSSLIFRKLTELLVGKHSHATKVISGSPGEIRQSHISPDAKTENFSMINFLYSDIYQIKLDKLISDRNQSLLKNLYGDDWLNVLNKKFEEIERKIHDDSKKSYGSIRAYGTTSEQLKAVAKSKLYSLAQHKQFKKMDFEKIHAKITHQDAERYSGKMLCSHFVALTTISAMVELNKQIESEAKKQDISFTRSPIEIPIAKHENLRTLLPSRFVQILENRGCVDKVESEIIPKYVK